MVTRVLAIYSRGMPLLNDLADYLAEETAMTVHEAIVLISSEDELPRARLFTKGVTVHGFFRAPAGLFMCVMTNTARAPFFTSIEEGNVEVDDVVRIDLTQDFLIEPNFPSKKIQIDGEFYAVPRNFTKYIDIMVSRARERKKRRR